MAKDRCSLKTAPDRTVTQPGGVAPAGLRGDAAVSQGHEIGWRYRIAEQLGCGGVGRVFRAYDRATEMEVALKVVRHEVGGRRSWRGLLGSEVRHARLVQHPNVCRIFDLGEADGLTFLTMELAEHGTLRKSVDDARARPLADRAADMRAVAAGMAAIHAAGLLHRDLKPENVLRMADGRVVVSDFGLAVADQISPHHSRGGTCGYMAPELVRGGKATRRSDVWALGVTMHEILRGHPPRLPEPFTSAGAEERLEAALTALCLGCCSRQARRRPPDAGEVLRRLQRLDGETLQARLARPMSVIEALRLGARSLEALAALHRQRDVHGAICPANILVARDGRVRLLRPSRDPDLAAAADPIYVPAGGRGGPAEDLVAIGAIVVRCLTGAPPSGGVMPSLPPALPARARRVLTRMLAADPSRRALHAAAVAVELAAAVDEIDAHPAARTRAGDTDFRGEQRWLYAVVVGEPVERVRALLRPGEEVELRVDSLEPTTTAITIGGPPRDLAAVAGRCALQLRAHLPAAPIAIAAGVSAARAGRGVVTGRACALLDAAPPGEIFLDPSAAAALAERYRVEQGTPARLTGEAHPLERPRTVLGVETPCFGRERVLCTLVGLWEECVQESVARAVLVTAAAGLGKTRVRHELLDRLVAGRRPFTQLVGRGDALRVGAPFALLGPALRAAAGIGEDTPADEAAGRLHGHLARLLPPASLDRAVALLGELAGLAPASASPTRHNTRLVGDQIRSAWLDYVHAACAQGPVVIVLEDLHWGDAASVQLVEAALRTEREQPLLVVGFARPAVDRRFPRLWADGDVQRMPLPPLTAGTAHRLIRHVLGEQAGTVDPGWIVERSEGNPLHLEELLRAVGGPRPQQLPAAILRITQSRFDGLPSATRRVLRAASLFGETFHAAGVRAVLRGGQDLDRHFETLVGREILYRRPGAPNDELAFRHALLQQGAYETLTPRDRLLGHARVARHLEARGERQALVLVEHHQRAGHRRQAAHWCLEAARQALKADDLAGAIDRARRGERLGARGRLLGRMLLVESTARKWRGDYTGAERAARRALDLVRGPERFAAAAALVAALGQLGRFDDVGRWARRLRGWTARAPRTDARLSCSIVTAGYLIMGRELEMTEELLAAVEAEVENPELRADAHRVRGLLAGARGDCTTALLHTDMARAAFDRLGDVRCTAEAVGNSAYLLLALGAPERAIAACRTVLRVAERLDLSYLTTATLLNLADAESRRGAPAAALGAANAALALARRQGDRRWEGSALAFLASLAWSGKDFPTAAQHARAAISCLAEVPGTRAVAEAYLARAQLAQGRTGTALALARAAHSRWQTMGSEDDDESVIPLAYAECLLAAGEQREGLSVLRAALCRLDRRAAAIDAGDKRRDFIQRNPVHARLVELAGERAVVLEECLAAATETLGPASSAGGRRRGEPAEGPGPV
jgi:serine/threonine protein kinase/tetratricopeptide (TPR) repeat protein